jgi:hypothetical protein
MAVQTDPVTEFADLTRRGQDSVADALELWTSTIQVGSQQAKNMQRVTDDLFALADHSIVAGREFLDYLTTVLRISAANVENWRKLTSFGLDTAQSATQWAGRTR